MTFDPSEYIPVFESPAKAIDGADGDPTGTVTGAVNTHAPLIVSAPALFGAPLIGYWMHVGDPGARAEAEERLAAAALAP